MDKVRDTFMPNGRGAQVKIIAPTPKNEQYRDMTGRVSVFWPDSSPWPGLSVDLNQIPERNLYQNRKHFQPSELEII